MKRESDIVEEKHDGLEVDEVKHKPRKKFKCNKLLPQPAFMMLMAAPRFSGKTNLLIKTLIDENMYCKKFDEIFIWSKSYYNDDKWKAINFDPEYEKTHVFTSYNEKFVQNLFEKLQQRSQKTPSNVLFIFDDMMGDNIQSAYTCKAIDRIAATGRHFDISAIIIFQKFKRFSPTTRENATNVIIFEQKNSKAIEQISEEYKGSLTKDEFLSIYKEAVKEPFHFLHINLQEPDQTRRFRKNWNTILILNNEENKDKDRSSKAVSRSTKDKSTS
jgi:hypothetical protein